MPTDAARLIRHQDWKFDEAFALGGSGQGLTGLVFAAIRVIAAMTLMIFLNEPQTHLEQ